MTRRIDTVKIAGTKYDARVKLSSDQKEAVKVLIKAGYSQRRVAAIFNVSRRLIQAILNPPARSPQPKHSAEYWNALKQKCREHKQALLLEGKLQMREVRKSKKNIKNIIDGNNRI